MRLWTFKIFVRPDDGRNPFEEWIKELDDADAEEKIRAMIRRLSVTRIWGRPHFAPIHGYKNIWEIIVKTKDKQYRPLGCFGPGPQVFTLLIGASKKGKVWTPPDAKRTAEKRSKMILADRRCIHEYIEPRKRSDKKPAPEQGT
jgi:hypothetical protein